MTTSDETLKLDKIPQRIEYNGYIWGLDFLRSTVIHHKELIYTKLQKLPAPTMQELMEHLAKGGWVKYTCGVGCNWFYRVLPSAGGELVRSNEPAADDWEHVNHLGRDVYNCSNFSLVKSI